MKKILFQLALVMSSIFPTNVLLAAEDGSQVFFFPQLKYLQADDDQVLDCQLKIYDKIAELASNDPGMPVFVQEAFFDPAKSHMDEIVSELEEYLEFMGDTGSPEKKSDLEELIIALKNSETLSDKQLKFLAVHTGFSPFNVDGFSFQESQLQEIRKIFPLDKLAKEKLNESQRGLLLRFGAVVVLAAKGVIQNIQKTDDLSLLSKKSASGEMSEDLKFDLEKSIVQLIADYQRVNPDDPVILVYQKGFNFKHYFGSGLVEIR